MSDVRDSADPLPVGTIREMVRTVLAQIKDGCRCEDTGPHEFECPGNGHDRNRVLLAMNEDEAREHLCSACRCVWITYRLAIMVDRWAELALREAERRDLEP